MDQLLNARIALSNLGHETKTVVDLLAVIERDTMVKVVSEELECDVVAKQIMQEIASEALLPYALNTGRNPDLVLVGHKLSTLVIETALNLTGFENTIPFEIIPSLNLRLEGQVILAVRSQNPLGPSFTAIKVWENVKNPMHVKTPIQIVI